MFTLLLCSFSGINRLSVFSIKTNYYCILTNRTGTGRNRSDGYGIDGIWYNIEMELLFDKGKGIEYWTIAIPFYSIPSNKPIIIHDVAMVFIRLGFNSIELILFVYGVGDSFFFLILLIGTGKVFSHFSSNYRRNCLAELLQCHSHS